jgi:Transposase
MGKPYSDDLRERVVASIEAGHSRVKVAELYNMALSTVGGFIKRKRETGSVSPSWLNGPAAEPCLMALAASRRACRWAAWAWQANADSSGVPFPGPKGY